MKGNDMAKRKDPETTMTEPTTEERTFTKILKVPLTDPELIQTGDDLATEHNDLRGVNNELESIRADYKAKVKAHEARIEILSIRMRDKFEMRPVDCNEQKNYAAKVLTVMRIDTGAIIESRDLRQDELQIPLPLDGEAAA